MACGGGEEFDGAPRIAPSVEVYVQEDGAINRGDMNIASWLRSLGLGQYAEAFAAAEIDEQRLRELSASDLRPLGVELLSHRRRLLAAIHHLRTGAEPPARLPPDELPP